MLLPKGTFQKLIDYSKIPKIEINCNECKFQEECIANNTIRKVQYPTGEMGYTKIGVHWLDNTCYFEVGKY
jgi:hypothetical protein